MLDSFELKYDERKKNILKGLCNKINKIFQRCFFVNKTRINAFEKNKNIIR
jgi:hypothetical protein